MMSCSVGADLQKVLKTSKMYHKAGDGDVLCNLVLLWLKWMPGRLILCVRSEDSETRMEVFNIL